MTMLRMGSVVAVVAAIAATPALADKGGVPHNGGGQGSDHAAQPATPAQPGAPGEGATPAQPAQPAHGHARGHSHKKATKRHSSPSTDRTSTPAPQSSHAKAGKTTICHATGSETNPYVEITISNNAIPAHDRHQDDKDIIPAPSGGCPGAQQNQATPSTSEAQAVTAASGVLGTSISAAVVSKEDEATAKPRSRVLGARSSSGADDADVAGDDADDATGRLPAEATASSDGSSRLPFTGMDLGILAAVGAAMVLAGIALKRARRGMHDVGS
jgi:hypothetical protein